MKEDRLTTTECSLVWENFRSIFYTVGPKLVFSVSELRDDDQRIAEMYL